MGRFLAAVDACMPHIAVYPPGVVNPDRGVTLGPHVSRLPRLALVRQRGVRRARRHFYSPCTYNVIVFLVRLLVVLLLLYLLVLLILLFTIVCSHSCRCDYYHDYYQ